MDRRLPLAVMGSLLLSLGCAKKGPEIDDSALRKKVSRDALGQLPSVGNRSMGSESKFDVALDESGRVEYGLVKRETVGRVNDPATKKELSCRVAAGTFVAIVGRSDDLLLAQLPTPCNVAAFGLKPGESALLSELWLPSNIVENIGGYDVASAQIGSDVAGAASKIGVDTNGAAGKNGVDANGAAGKNGVDANTNTGSGCREVYQILGDRIHPSGQPVNACNSAKQQAFLKENGDLLDAYKTSAPEAGILSSLLAAACRMPGPLWRAGATGYNLHFRGSAARWRISMHNEVVNGFVNLGNPECGRTQAHSIGGNFAPASGNCDTIAPVEFAAHEVESLDQNGLYSLPMEKFVKNPNDWMGSLVKITVTGLDSSGRELGSCEHHLQLASPIVLDFTGDNRLATLSPLESAARFDLDGDGKADRSGWVTGERAFLALDLNGNGRIDDGRELFGDSTLLQQTGAKAQHGYEALSQYAPNQDGFIDRRDPIFDRLLLWFDRNGDGVSQPEELKALAVVGVTRIGTTFVALSSKPGSNLLALENDVRFKGVFYGPAVCGAKGCSSYDVYFATMSSLVRAPK